MEIFGNLERLIDDIYPYRWLVAILAAVGALLLATVAYRYGWHLAIMRHKLRTTLVAVPLLVIAIPVSYYLLSPLWTRTTIYEESPLAAAGITVAGVPAATGTPMSITSDDAAESTIPSTDASATTATTRPSPTPEPPAPTSELTATDEPSPTSQPAPEPTTDPAPEPTVEPASEPILEPTPEPEPTVEQAPAVFTPRLVSSGPLSGADDFHFAEGTALLIETQPGVYVLRLEEFSVRNGPDLFVYLAASPDHLDDTAINLGGLRATDGSINYDVPPGTDITRFQGVVIWCRAFAVFFGSAPLIAS